MAVKGKGLGVPLDPVEDFNRPTTAPGSHAADQVGTEQLEESKQLELEGAKPAEPKVIRDGKMLAQFVRPHFEKEESGDRFVGFEFAFPLTKEHEENGHLPAEVLQEWKHMRKGNVKRTEVASVAPQTIAVNLVPDNPRDDLILVAAAIGHPILANVEEKGSGKTQKVIRFSFRAVVDQVEQIARFAVDHHGDPVWISIQRTQGSLLE
jgi:hypothetical protein